ncbi:hypothetical protein J2X76_003625 [Neorhizobium sp. 2083]|uniref:hypothetical protein n=1 Tax=Neorhizobium sp. 2083 TaxID=2817762 RepID=UPI00285BF9BD|nr:hypothetical protein [Neorhizobium sp. 2083]MDR6818448.1 hypothetical protein [Neorhizobium sp. 2083]
MTVTPEQAIENIRQALEAGPYEGPWTIEEFQHDGRPCALIVSAGGTIIAEIRGYIDSCGNGENARFIAACNPQNVAVLLFALQSAADTPAPSSHVDGDRLDELTKQRDHFRDQWRACWAPLTPRSENEKRGFERVLAILKSKLSDGGGIVGPSEVQRAHNDFYRGRRVAFEECATMLRAALEAEGQKDA